MATKPQIKTLTSSSVDILNAIRNYATTNYQNYVPIATPDAESIREIGAVIMANPSLQNEFLNALVNRIGRVIVTSKMYSNPWAMFKKGVLDFGETIEEIFVNIAKPFQYDPNVAEQTVFKREIPDVRAAFHVMNYQKYYKATIQNEQLRQAFLSWDGVSDLIARIVDSMYTGANYDEFQTMKYLLAKHITNGLMFPVNVGEYVDPSNAKSITTAVKGFSNKLTFMSNKYNLAGVSTHTEKRDQYLLVNSDFDAIMDVEVLASAFNMDKAEFMGHRVLVDSFGSLDIERLNVLFADDPTYTEFSEEELEALDAIPCVLVDRDWFMIFDVLYNFTEQYNGEGLYWNYWYHVWKTFSVSPYANNAVFVPGTPVVTNIAVSPSNISLGVGQSATFAATVTTDYFAPQTVDWTTDSEYVSINASGQVTVLDGASGSVTVTARSTFNNSAMGTATITIV